MMPGSSKGLTRVAPRSAQMRAAMASRSSVHPVIGDDLGAKGAGAFDLGRAAHRPASRSGPACRTAAPPPPRPGHDCRRKKPPRRWRVRRFRDHRQRLQAPRNLKEPVRCRVSSFRNTRPPVSAFSSRAFHQRRAHRIGRDARGGGLNIGESWELQPWLSIQNGLILQLGHQAGPEIIAELVRAPS